MQPEILVTGGTGKTGRQIARQLADKGVPARMASRSGAGESGQMGLRFDWTDSSTHAAALSGTSAIYLVAPQNTLDPYGVMLPFLEAALRIGVRRYALLSTSAIDEGGPLMGKVHQWLKAEAPEWAVLRPSWFMQNLVEPLQLAGIQSEGAIYSATGNGRIGFIDTADIAAVAVAALTNTDPLNDDFILTGPQALSYSDAADIISEQSGLPVVHHSLSGDALVERWTKSGLPLAYAQMLTDLDLAIADGSENRVTDNVLRVSGRSPNSFQAFVEAQRAFQPTQYQGSIL